MRTGSLSLVRGVAGAAKRHALEHALWTGPQLDYHTLPGRYRVWYGANGQGKTRALAAEIVWRLRGVHPFRVVHKPPIEILLMVEGFEAVSTVDLSSAIWGFLNPDEVSRRSGFTPGRGFQGRPPRVEIASGPGAGSVLHISTYGAGAKRAAGGTFPFVGCNEPMPEEMWGEVIARGRGVSGEVAIVFTPTLSHPVQAWLRTLCHTGAIDLPRDDIERDWMVDRRTAGTVSLLQTSLTADSLRLVHPGDYHHWPRCSS